MHLGFSVSSTPNIIFGIGKRKELPKLVKKYATTIGLVLGNSSFTASNYGKQMLAMLEEAEITFYTVSIPSEPTPEQIDEAVAQLKAKNVGAIVAIGGGSVLDAGKAIAAMMCETGSVVKYLEGVGDSSPSGKKLPFIALPTTSGTGSEATKNAVITSLGEKGFKKSLRHDNYIPTVALIDPELTITCSKELTAASGMDAFTQLLESYLSDNASPFTDSLALQGLLSIKKGLKASVLESTNEEARTEMSYAALLSGITLANAGLGTVHGFASSIGGFFDIPHGVVCGTLMGATNRVTIAQIRATQNGEYALKKYAQVGKLFHGTHSETEDFYIDFILNVIDTYTEEFQLKKLSDYGVTELDFNRIIKATGNKNNPVALNADQLKQILEERL